MSAIDVTVIVPALNERENIIIAIPQIRKIVEKLGITAEILIVDGNSSDGTREAAEALGARVVVQKERGYGGALLAGFAEARSQYIATMDADLSHPPEFLEQFWRCRNSADLLIASRYVPGGKAEMSVTRYLLSRVLNFTFAKVLSIPLRDMSSGFRLYKREIVAGLKLESSDFDVLEEILVKAYNEGWQVRELPFHYMPRASGRSHAKLLKFGWAYLTTIVRMWRLRHAPVCTLRRGDVRWSDQVR
jgi:dolichol-phosphate mannosyltransferase